MTPMERSTEIGAELAWVVEQNPELANPAQVMGLTNSQYVVAVSGGNDILLRFEEQNPELANTVKVMGLTIPQYNDMLLSRPAP